VFPLYRVWSDLFYFCNYLVVFVFFSDGVIFYVFVLLHPCCISVFIIIYISDAKGFSAKK